MTKGAAPHCTRPATPSGLHEPETAHEVPQQRPRAAGRTNRSSQSYQAALPGGARAPATAGAPPGARCRTRALQPRQRLPLGQRAPIRALAARHGLGHYLVAALQVVCRPEQVPPEALRDVLNAPAMRCQRRHASYCFSLKKKYRCTHTTTSDSYKGNGSTLGACGSSEGRTSGMPDTPSRRCSSSLRAALSAASSTERAILRRAHVHSMAAKQLAAFGNGDRGGIAALETDVRHSGVRPLVDGCAEQLPVSRLQRPRKQLQRS